MASHERNELNELPKTGAVAVAVTTALGGHAGFVQAQEGASGGLEEIVVTARKREESLQDISASIQALTESDLKRQGLHNMEDVIRFLPSVSHVGGTAGANKIIFRGVSDNPGAFIAASSAALYIDEQPLTQFSINPEPRMVDIERVEALAGPQGTLYGDSSQSGTLRIITNKPDPTEFSASTEFMVRSGGESSESYEVNGVLNLPIVEDKFALRLVGFSARDGGFVDNVLGVSPMRGTRDNSDVVGDDINEVDHVGGRVSAKWFVNDDWAITATGIYQDTEAGGRNDYDPTVGDLQTVKFFRDERDDQWSQFALTIEGSFAGLDFLSSTSYFDRSIDYVFDRTTYSAYFNYNFCPVLCDLLLVGQRSGQPGHGRLQYAQSGERSLHAGVPALEDDGQVPLGHRCVLRREKRAVGVSGDHAGFPDLAFLLRLDGLLRSLRGRPVLVAVRRQHEVGPVGRVRQLRLRLQ